MELGEIFTFGMKVILDELVFYRAFDLVQFDLGQSGFIDLGQKNLIEIFSTWAKKSILDDSGAGKTCKNQSKQRTKRPNREQKW